MQNKPTKGNGLPLLHCPAYSMRHHLFPSIIAFWLLVVAAFALLCRSGSSGEVSELKSNSAGNNNEVGKQASLYGYFILSCMQANAND